MYIIRHNNRVSHNITQMKKTLILAVALAILAAPILKVSAYTCPFSIGGSGVYDGHAVENGCPRQYTIRAIPSRASQAVAPAPVQAPQAPIVPNTITINFVVASSTDSVVASSTDEQTANAIDAVDSPEIQALKSQIASLIQQILAAIKAKSAGK